MEVFRTQDGGRFPPGTLGWQAAQGSLSRASDVVGGHLFDSQDPSTQTSVPALPQGPTPPDPAKCRILTRRPQRASSFSYSGS